MYPLQGEADYDQSYLEKVGFPLEGMEDSVIYRARKSGCAFCNRTGFRGRIGLYEVLVIGEDVEKLVVSLATSRDIGNLAREKGMKTLREDGFGKVMQGVTSIEGNPEGGDVAVSTASGCSQMEVE